MKKMLGLLSLAALASVALTSCATIDHIDTQEKFDAMTKIVVGLECDYQPFNWTEVASNEYTYPISNLANMYADGYDIQLAKQMATYFGKDLEIVATPWDSLIPDLNAGTIDLVIAGMTDTEERRLEIDFTNEYYRSELVLIVDKTVADTYTTILDNDTLTTVLNGQIVVSQISTVTYSCIDTFVKKNGAIKATALKTFGLCATDVSSGAAFAMTAELPVALSLTASFTNLGIIHIDQSILGDATSELGVSIGIRKGDSVLKEKINEFLATLSDSDRLDIMTGAVDRSAA